DRAGRIRSWKIYRSAVSLGFLYQVKLPGLHNAAEACDLPRCASRRGVLHRPSSDINCRATSIKDFDEIVLEGRADVSAASVNLANHQPGRRSVSRRNRNSHGENEREKCTKKKVEIGADTALDISVRFCLYCEPLGKLIFSDYSGMKFSSPFLILCRTLHTFLLHLQMNGAKWSNTGSIGRCHSHFWTTI